MLSVATTLNLPVLQEMLPYVKYSWCERSTAGKKMKNKT